MGREASCEIDQVRTRERSEVISQTGEKEYPKFDKSASKTTGLNLAEF
jgi:hypothetical protein